MRDAKDIQFFSLTDVGIKRSHNQDSLGVVLAPNNETFQTKGHLFLVADGMGAHAVGELASKLAVDTIRHAYGKLRDLDPEETIRSAIIEANQTIHERGAQNPDFRGMGTTATALVVNAEGARVGHVGDSRCYRVRKTIIEQLSYDHSLQWELARKHRVNPDTITSVPSNIIVRSLGPEPRVKVDVNGPYDILDGDKFLLCSDGLSGPVTDQELWAVVAHLQGEEACRFLVDLANIRGGLDNITVILIQVGEPSPNHVSGPSKLLRLRQAAWRLVKRVSMPWWFLVTGIATSALGFLLGAMGAEEQTFGVLLGTFAISLMGIALWGLIRRRESKIKEPIPTEPEPPPIYRSSVCELTPAIVERFAEIEQHLHELAIEEKWKVDWTELGKSHSDAVEHRKADRLADAFRLHCGSISTLAAGMRAARDKQEVFRPTWERKKPG